MSQHASKFSILQFRTKLVLIGIFLFAIGSVFSAGGASAANPSATLDQCANDPFPSPNTDGCDTNANQWVNGNLGASKANYSEGDSVPYRITMQNLSLTPDHHITIEWDTTKSSKHALDYLTSFNRTVTTANPCLGVSGCGSPTPFAIPADPQVTDAGVTPVAGNFTMFGGTITGVSDYSYSNGTGFVGDKSASITLTFTPTQANPVLAWGGHIATRQNWGAGNSAVAISGSPYHTRLLNLDGSGGNQDRSLSAEAVIFPGSITIIKDAVPNDAQDFSFAASGGTLTPTSFILDDDAEGTRSNQQAYADIKTFTAYTFTEASVSGWTLSFQTPVCTVTSANGGTQSGNVGTRTLTINLNEGENVTCTFVNTRQAAKLIVIKHVVNDNGGTATAGDFTMTVTGGSPSPGSFAGAESPGVEVTLTPNTAYDVTESSVSGYTNTGESSGCHSTTGIAPGGTATCTITNNDQAATLKVIKHVINDNGGTATAANWSIHVQTGDPLAEVTGSPQAGAEAPGTSYSVAPGTYTVSETGGPSGYTFTGFSGDCADPSGTVTLALGETKTCTLTNDDIAQNTGQITPTGTTCNQFNNGSATTLSELLYTTKSGNINSVAPGVFFYWIKIDNVVAGSSNSFTINQAVTPATFTHFFNQAAGSFVFDSNCAKVATQSINTSNGVTTVNFTATSAGTYIIGVKYDSGSVKGFAPPTGGTAHYDFSTSGVPGSTQGIDLKPKL
jgi:hypothetical protein